MTGLVPCVREAGAGPGVVCLHSNASTSSQWRALMAQLSPDYRVFAPDSLGAGRSPAWSGAVAGLLSRHVARVPEGCAAF